MNLTQEDLAAIQKMINESVERKLDTILDTLKHVVKSQLSIVEKTDHLGNVVVLVMHHLGMSQEARDLKSTLAKLG